MTAAKPQTGIRSDAELLTAIGTRRDREAFEELYRRHERGLYGLALRITGSPAAAEDAVQEALVRVWTGAETFREEGNARGWLFRLLAMECIRILRGRKRDRRVRPLAEDNLAILPNAAAEDAGAQKHEVAEALSRLVAHLEPAERRLVALYYGAGLSQREIGDALELTQQAVSNKLAEALQRLRLGLKQAGFAAALPLLEDSLGASLGRGVEVPAGLGEKITARIIDAGKASRRAAAASGSSALLWTGAALLVLAGGAGWWALREAPPPAKATEFASNKDAEKGAQTAQAAVPATRAPFHAVWTFEKGLPGGMEIVYGRWNTGEAYDGRHFLLTNFNELTLIKLPMKIEDRFYRIRCKIWPNPEAPKARTIAHLTVYPTRGRKLTDFDLWASQGMTGTAETDVEYWVLGRALVNRMNGELRSLVVFDTEVVYDEFFLRVRNWWVREISVDSVEPGSVPPEMKDLETLKKKIGGEVMRSEGAVELFEFRDPPKQ
ncbi:MAG: sigma-70 family RNA polymerase sigma factor [Planctomycetes bacterium]|nr:sigma-70 family RNA polymerase sigma factor [Planctomycetota bacterium]